MEEGTGNVADYLADGKHKLSILKLGDLALSLTEVVAAANQEEYVWTDVKPENFVRVLRGTNNDFEYVGVDVETMVKEGGTLSPQQCVTAEYCAPELAAAMAGGKEAMDRLHVTPKLDAWALGMMLFYVFHPDHITYFWEKGLKNEEQVGRWHDDSVCIF